VGGIRVATAADADAIAALHAESWRSAYRGLIPDDDLGADPRRYGDRIAAL
jgi:hypothetical protein